MIKIAFITAMIVILFHAFAWKGMVFYFIDEALCDLPDYFKKPLYSCPICMSIWWGPAILAVGILAKLWQFANFLQIAIIVCLAAAMNIFLIYIINVLKNIAKLTNND